MGNLRAESPNGHIFEKSLSHGKVNWRDTGSCQRFSVGLGLFKGVKMFRPMVFGVVVLNSCWSAAAQQRTFEGNWNNRKYNSSGKMTCVANETSPGQWTGVFSGVFQGERFQFTAQFQGRASAGGTELSGDARIRGAQYQWSGALVGNQLRGRYRASNGYNGEFALNETGVRPGTTAGSQSTNTLQDIEIEPVIQNGQHLLLVDNGLMGDESGVSSYLQRALEKRGIQITTSSQMNAGKRLREMVTPEVGLAMTAPDVDAVIIPIGDLATMKQFAKKLKDSGKKLFVFMTWERQHPGNRTSLSRYTAATRSGVREMRRMEKETGATIVPTAVLFHDLTTRPPDGMPRVDYLWKKNDENQNELGTMVSAWLMMAMLTGETPVGSNFDMPPSIVGERIQSDPEIRLSRQLRQELQYRTWSVAQAWTRGKCHLE